MAACSDQSSDEPAEKGTYLAAYQAYRAYAATKLGLAVDQVGGIGPNEEVAKLQRGKVGQVWAFEAHPASAPTPEARGWADTDGLVVTLEQNLGRLFVEAGAWGGGVSPALGAAQLADTLTWALGTGHEVYVSTPTAPAPVLAIADGAGSLTFYVDYRAPGPGPAPRSLSRITVALTASHQATLTRTPLPP